jgi:DNA modification methylase
VTTQSSPINHSKGGTGGKNNITYLVGDVRERMREIADNSVSLVATSPP